MRALCGAIISAGALLGLGLFAIGYGIRYQGWMPTPEKKEHLMPFRELDTALMAGFWILIAALVIGLGIAFVGLAFHHHRRHWEMHGKHAVAPGGSPPAAGAAPASGERVSV